MGAELTSVPTPALDEADVEAERFFAEGEASSEGSLAPSTLDEELWETPRPRPLDPAVLARRARFRRWVAIGLTSGVSVLVTLIGATRLARVSRTQSHRTHAVHAPAPSRPVATPPSPPLTAPPVAARSVAAPPVVVAPPLTPSAATPAPADALHASARELTRKARALLQSGHAREGIEAARAAVEADETRPESYVLLAAGLEDVGAWSEARKTFALCSERTQSSECRYFAGGRR